MEISSERATGGLVFEPVGDVVEAVLRSSGAPLLDSPPEIRS
jgi:hypothetical protein